MLYCNYYRGLWHLNEHMSRRICTKAVIAVDNNSEASLLEAHSKTKDSGGTVPQDYISTMHASDETRVHG